MNSVDIALGGQPILRGINLEVPYKTVMPIFGSNGSGKSTLLRAIATLVRPSAGTGSVLGQDLNDPSIRSVRPRIGLISHTPGLIEELTILENLEHFAVLGGRSAADCVHALDVVGLKKITHRRVSESSFGMQRRAEIAWQLVAKPDLLLLDEAKSGLDTEARQLVESLVDLTVDRGGSVIAVSHESSRSAEGFDVGYQLVGGQLRRAG